MSIPPRGHTVLFVDGQRVGIIKDVEWVRPAQIAPGMVSDNHVRYEPSIEASLYVTLTEVK